MSNFNLDKFKRLLNNPENYAPIETLRALDRNSQETNLAYDSAINLIEETPELRTLFQQSDHKTRESIGELLAAGILEKQKRQDILDRPWAHPSGLPVTPKIVNKLPTTAKKSRFSQKKPMTAFESGGGFK